ncbi:hypothetical protein GJ496_010377 [Pomphorhynchus laevis]|nr:hypothetical protein GJ496_010377 [Pomphorhynchus laevis]
MSQDTNTIDDCKTKIIEDNAEGMIADVVDTVIQDIHVDKKNVSIGQSNDTLSPLQSFEHNEFDSHEPLHNKEDYKIAITIDTEEHKSKICSIDTSQNIDTNEKDIKLYSEVIQKSIESEVHDELDHENLIKCIDIIENESEINPKEINVDQNFDYALREGVNDPCAINSVDDITSHSILHDNQLDSKDITDPLQATQINEGSKTLLATEHLPTKECRIAETSIPQQFNPEQIDPKSKSNMKVQSVPQQTYASILQPMLSNSRFPVESKQRSVTIVAKSISISAERRAKPSQHNKISSTLNSIKDEHHVIIEIHDSSNGDLNLVVRGRPRNVDFAIDGILSRLSVPNRVLIPDYVPIILMKTHTKTIDSIESKFECRLDVKLNNKAIYVYSSSDEAAESVNNALNEFFLKLKNISVETLKIPKIYHPWIRGPRGETINRIRKDTNTDISMPSLQSPYEDIVVSGQIENVTRACAGIHQAYSAQVVSLCAATFDIPRSQQKILREDNSIGLDKILEKTNVSVELPASVTTTAVTLRGCNNSAIGEALSMINTLTNSNCEETIPVPQVLNRVIRSKLPVLKSNMDSVYIDISRDSVIVKGSPSIVSRTSDYLKTLIANLMLCIANETLVLDNQQQQTAYRDFRQKCAHYRKVYNVFIKRTNDPSKLNLEGEPENIKIVKDDIIKSCQAALNDIVKIIKIDREFHGKLIGTRGSKINEIKTLFDVNIAVPAAHENKNEITIRGSNDEVERCVRYINDFVEDMKKSDHVEDLVIPKYYHRLIIGHKGIKIQEIRRVSNAIVEIPTPEDSNEAIRLRGNREEVAKAKNMINSLVNSKSEEAVDIPIAVHYYFTRKNNIMQQLKGMCTNVQLTRPSNRAVPAQFILRGVKDDVIKTAEFLREEISKAMESHTAETVKLSQLQKSFIQNNCSEFMSNLASQYDVTILNNSDDNEASFQFCGKIENVKDAFQIFTNKLAEIGDVFERKVKVPTEYHNHFLRRDGSLLEHLKDNYSVDIIVPSHRSLNENFIIQGNANSVQATEEKILQLIEEWRNDISVVVPCEFIPFLKSNMRSIVGQIEFKCNVQIDIVDKKTQNSEDDYDESIQMQHLLVTGNKDNIKMASELIAQNTPIESFLDVPKQYHSKIIGRQGIEINKIKRNSGVNEIVVPNRDNTDHQSPILLRGTAESVIKAKELILELINQTNKSRNEPLSAEGRDRMNIGGASGGDPNFVTCSIDVPKHFHPRIIGRSGRTINRLRQEFDVDIIVPALGSDSSDTAIAICGLPENCERAQAQIKSLIEESFSVDNPLGEDTKQQRPGTYPSRYRFAQNLNRQRDRVTKHTIVDANSVPRLIGSKGKSINRFRDQYHVDVRFNSDPNNPDMVVVSGSTERIVDDAIEALVQLSIDTMANGDRNYGVGTTHSTADYEYEDRRRLNQNQVPPDTSDLNEFPVF